MIQIHNFYNFQIPNSSNILGFENFKDVLASHKKFGKSALRNQISASESETDMAPDPTSNSDSVPNLSLAPDKGPVRTPNSHILLDFYSSASDRKLDIPSSVWE